MGQPWLLGPGSQLLQVAPAEDSHSPLLGPGPTYKGQEEMPSRHYKNVCRLERKGTEGPWPSHVASEGQADTQTPVLCSQSLQGLRPSRGHLCGEGEYQDIWCGSPASGWTVLLETDGQP